MKTIDIHIHGGFGICFDNATTSQIKDFAKQAFEKEIYAFCPTLTGDTIDKLNEKLQIINEAKKTQGKNEAKIIGVNLEGTFLSKSKPGIQNPDVFLEPKIDNFKRITKGLEDIVKIVVVAPEDRNCADFIQYLKAKKIKVHYGHTLARNIEGADGICHLYNAMEPMTHKHPTLAVKALLDKEIYTELIADCKHVTEEVLDLTFKTRPKDKIILISDALPIASSGLDSITFCNKKIYKNGKDENGTLGGSIMLLPDIVSNLIDKKILAEKEALDMAYYNPLNYLNLIE